MGTYFDLGICTSNVGKGEDLILASSSKQLITINQQDNDPSTAETRRMKTSNSKADSNCRSVVSIIGPEDSRKSLKPKRRNLQVTPNESKGRSSAHFKRIVNSYSSKMEKRNNGNIIPWSSNIKSLPKQSNRYSRASSKRKLAQAYRSIPKETVMSNKKGVGSRRIKNSKKPKIPPSFKDIGKDDQTLCLLLKHLRTETGGKLPNVNSHAEIQAANNFINSKRSRRKEVSRIVLGFNVFIINSITNNWWISLIIINKVLT